MTSFLVAAGACLSGSQYWCALEGSQCPFGSTFVSAKRLETDYQNSPAIQCLNQAGTVPMGQCTMPDDKGLCTGNKSNCGGCFETAEKCFEPNNGACTLEATENKDGSLNFAVFGICVDPEDPTEGHCLWSYDECPSTDIWATPNSWLETTTNIEDFCTCDKVLVGACQYGNEFECAVSEDACEDGIPYIGAKTLFDMKPSIDCRLCNSLDLPQDAYPVSQQQIAQNAVSNYQGPKETAAAIVDSSLTQRSSYLAAAGACMAVDQYWCVLEKTACPVGSNFVSARKLESDYPNSAAIQCLGQAGTVPMGQCTRPVDKGLCTGNKSNCGGCFETAEKCFEPNNGACTLEASENSDGSLNFAVFGLCVNPAYPKEGHCLWRQDECPSTDIWATPNSWLETIPNVKDYCTCDKVLVGACRYGDQFVCAVSEDACDEGSEYIGAKALDDMKPSINCRLCDSLDLPQDAYPVKFSPVPPKDNEPEIIVTMNSSGSKNQLDYTSALSRDTSKGPLISIILLSVVCVALVVTIWKVEKRKKTRSRAADDEGLVIDADGSAIVDESNAPLSTESSSDESEGHSNLEIS